MKKGFKFTGFTLTELLVVVIVIGVLSAAVLPKFSKVIETRKTTEAEELMASIRTEQEKRCALDKQYLKKLSDMADIVKNNDTKNYTLTLEGSGVLATSKGSYSYELRIPSYADGRICCAGDDCEKLNKTYPNCDDLKKSPDYTPSPKSCIPLDSEPDPVVCNDCSCAEYKAAHPAECNPAPTPVCDNSHQEGEIYKKACTCGEAQGKWHCGEDTGYRWKQQETVGCVGKPSDQKQDCEDGTGTQTRTFVCENGIWTAQEWGECVPNKTCETPDTSNGCSSGEKWGDCSHFDANGGWCYRFTWDSKQCTWVKQGAGGPPTYCTAAKTAMSPYYCECTEPVQEEPKYVWKQEWQFPLFYKDGALNSGVAADINRTLLSCRNVTLHDWSEISTQCSGDMTVGGECKNLGERCVKKGRGAGNWGTGSMGMFCDVGIGGAGVGADRNCIYMRDYINQFCQSSSAYDRTSWAGYQMQGLHNALLIQVTSYVCGQQ
ncbi:MAG: prepilin-type N-terminal cleavage/methylation domain-containing protein [Elusimicrobiaceae bacterium]|nr:prepilin-type N-terminal cleavage/methylation domain-containing protein [Elusimicrobiaceae bacterium]